LKGIVPLVLAVALAVSVGLNVYLMATPKRIIGIVDHKKLGIGMDGDGRPVEWYTVSLWLITDDSVNGFKSGTTIAYMVDKGIYDEVEPGAVVRAEPLGNVKIASAEILKKGSNLPAGSQMDFQSISKGYYSGHRKRAQYVIQDDEEWTKAWNQHMSIRDPRPSPPKVDFSNTTVLAVFMGEFPTGGHAIEIKEVIDKGNLVIVKVEETYPGKGCIVTEAFSQPYHIIRVSKIDKEIVFETVKKTFECG